MHVNEKNDEIISWMKNRGTEVPERAIRVVTMPGIDEPLVFAEQLDSYHLRLVEALEKEAGLCGPETICPNHWSIVHRPNEDGWVARVMFNGGTREYRGDADTKARALMKAIGQVDAYH